MMKKPYMLMNGDCLKKLKRIPDNKIALTLTSPPYDDARQYGGMEKWSINLSKLGDELYRVTKDGGVCVVVINDMTHNRVKTLTSFKLAVDWCTNRGWKLWETLIYSRPGIPSNHWTKRFRTDHEYIFVFLKGDNLRYIYKDHLNVPSVYGGKRIRSGKRINSKGERRGNLKKFTQDLTKCRGTVWEVITSNRESGKETPKFKHPATFGNRFAEDIILCFSKQGDIVLDPMCGSGTTVAMALKHKRHGVGIEINPDYAKIAQYYIDINLPLFNQQEVL